MGDVEYLARPEGCLIDASGTPLRLLWIKDINVEGEGIGVKVLRMEGGVVSEKDPDRLGAAIEGEPERKVVIIDVESRLCSLGPDNEGGPSILRRPLRKRSNGDFSQTLLREGQASSKGPYENLVLNIT